MGSLNKLLILALSICLISCGGGSSGGDDSSDQSFTFNACSLVKVANGETCEPSATGSRIVSLAIVDFFGETGLCSGTLISPTAILTAGHCFITGASVVQVSNGPQTLFADRIIVHPSFSQSQDVNVLFNDVAIVTTTTALTSPVTPILVSRRPNVGEESVVAGYGETPGGGNDEASLITGNAFITNVSDNHVTTVFSGEQASPCRGDSGAGILVQEAGGLAIVGIVSQSEPSVPEEQICQPGDVTLYAATHDSSIFNFIFETVPDAGAI